MSDHCSCRHLERKGDGVWKCVTCGKAWRADEGWWQQSLKETIEETLATVHTAAAKERASLGDFGSEDKG